MVANYQFYGANSPSRLYVVACCNTGHLSRNSHCEITISAKSCWCCDFHLMTAVVVLFIHYLLFILLLPCTQLRSEFTWEFLHMKRYYFYYFLFEKNRAEFWRIMLELQSIFDRHSCGEFMYCWGRILKLRTIRRRGDQSLCVNLMRNRDGMFEILKCRGVSYRMALLSVTNINDVGTPTHTSLESNVTLLSAH